MVPWREGGSAKHSWGSSALWLVLFEWPCFASASFFMSENIGQMGLQGKKQKNLQKNDLFVKLK